MPNESPDQYTIRRQSDPPITDWQGNEWRLGVAGIVMVNGLGNAGLRGVVEMVYASRLIWAYSGGEWFLKSTPTDRWEFSPDGPPLGAAGRTQDGINSILDLVQALTSQFQSGLSLLANAAGASNDGISHLLALLTEDRKAVSVRFVVPYFITPDGRIIPMAINIVGNMTSVIPLEFDNAGGTAVPAPTGGTGTVTASNAAAFNVTMGADGVSVHVSPVQPPQAGAITDITYTDTLPDGTNLTGTLTEVTIAADLTATSVHFNTAAITTEPLPAGP